MSSWRAPPGSSFGASYQLFGCTLSGQSGFRECTDHAIAMSRPQRRHAELQSANRKLRIARAEHAEAAAGLWFCAGAEIGRAERAMHPQCSGVVAQRPLLPVGRLRISAVE